MAEHLVLSEHLVIGNETIGKMSLEDRAALERICHASISGSYDKVAA